MTQAKSTDLASGVAKVGTTYALQWKWTVAHSPNRVWTAITSSEEMSRWMSGAALIEPNVRGRFRIDWGSSTDAKDGIVVEIENERLLVHTWPMPAPGSEPGRQVTLVRWTVEPDGDGSVITFSHSGLNREHAIGLGSGWLGFLEQFNAVLDGRPLLPLEDLDARAAPSIERWERDFDQGVMPPSK